MPRPFEHTREVCVVVFDANQNEVEVWLDYRISETDFDEWGIDLISNIRPFKGGVLYTPTEDDLSVWNDEFQKAVNKDLENYLWDCRGDIA